MNGFEHIRGIGRIRCYDAGPRLADRYTVIFEDFDEREPWRYALGMSADPFHPQGVGQHTTAMPGSHLGRRVPFAELPEPVQRCVMLEAS